MILSLHSFVHNLLAMHDLVIQKNYVISSITYFCSPHQSHNGLFNNRLEKYQLSYCLDYAEGEEEWLV